MAEHRAAKRHKRRLACEIGSAGRIQSAIVLDLSESGIFVQTGTRLPPGAEVEVRLLLNDGAESLLLHAKVARNKQVPPQLTSVARGGIGLRIIDAPAAYYDTLAVFNGTGGPEKSTGKAAAPAPPRTRYRVRVKQAHGPRSRSVEILADSPAEAKQRALSDAGSGWEAVGAELIG